ncbi:hypothetical protein DSO57_1026669 [Entomophthora muscae]|uniref:Uncharacterized protein n=1 Tax=Entomophthora muscae TaxID=34485 RepID=A0ACC2RSW7_9FUNG|nr:hypothetical protein DSO57_1026669 [Entomophthora muscae]
MNLWFKQVIPYLILVLFHLQSTSCGSAPSAYSTQETTYQPSKLYCPSGAPFGPVHLTLYPSNLAYLEFTLEKILIYNSEARTRETDTIYREGCFSQTVKKEACVQANPLQSLENLAHTVDERFVLAFTGETPIPSLETPPTVEETLIQLDCLLSWCCPVLRQLESQQKNAGHRAPGVPNLLPREIGYKIPQSAESQESNSSSPEVPWTKIIEFGSSPVGTSEESIRGNVHPESPEGS